MTIQPVIDAAAAAPALDTAVVPLGRRRLHVPHGSRHVPPEEWREIPMPVPDKWRRIAEEKGFLIHARIRDRLHLALQCRVCFQLTAHKVYTLTSVMPACAACAETARKTAAEAVGLTLLHRDPDDRHYGLYVSSCGHRIRRQFGSIARIAAAGGRIRCRICHLDKERREGRDLGWRRIGPDPRGRRGYRMYRHLCGHRQAIARSNLLARQVDCGGCSGGWGARQSHIYLMRLTFPDLVVIKLGFSVDPERRHQRQFGLSDDVRVDVLRTIATPSGHAAIAAEKRAHVELRRRFPKAVVPRERVTGRIRVVSELYDPRILPDVHKLLDRVESEIGTG